VEKLLASDATKNALQQVIEARSAERIIIVCDEAKKEVGDAFANGAIGLDLWTRMLILKKEKRPRKTISKKICQAINQKPDIFINILPGSREETPFRISLIKKELASQESRLGHCPGITLDMLTQGALALSKKEHKSIKNHAKNLIKLLKNTKKVEIYNPTGTSLTFKTKNRPFFTDTKIEKTKMNWINLPTGEVIVAPNEDSLNGTLVCDMAIGGIGKLTKPVYITAKNGKVETVSSLNKQQLYRITETFRTDNGSDVIGEFAFGINPKARFTEEFLESEKILGTVHIAFGNNIDMPGGKNTSKNHMDVLISSPTVVVTKDNKEKILVLENGKFQS
jgi:leucyl aminopeptidase (aminopeptidase T)